VSSTTVSYTDASGTNWLGSSGIPGSSCNIVLLENAAVAGVAYAGSFSGYLVQVNGDAGLSVTDGHFDVPRLF
jgi:hypothetical protein